MERAVRYCTTEDGVRIAYGVEGEGLPLIALPAFFESFSHEHVMPGRTDALREMTHGRQLVFMDRRGTGLSEKNLSDLSTAAFRRDIDAVLLALGARRVSLLGSVSGGVTALDYAVNRPDKVDRLVLHTTFARVMDVFSSELLNSIGSLARSNWDLTTRTLADFGARREESAERGLRAADWIRRSMTGEFVSKMLEANADVDLKPQLAMVKAATLILHPVDDPMYPLALGQELASAIPNSRLVPLRHAGYAYESLPKDVLQLVNAFLNERIQTVQQPPAEKQSAFRTVLFTDLVAHTEMMSRLGDDAGRAVLREHERITREVLKQYAGTEVKTMGDGFLASFGSVTKAVECAIALQRAFAEHQGEPLAVRVGLNAGEPIEEDGDLFGATVILASRIAAKAAGGEILVADTVRGLCSGKGFLFADRGDFVAKGFEEPVRVYEVSWRHTTSS